MAGKGSLLLVMGFSLLFLVFGHNFNSVSSRTVDNYTEYFSQTVAHDLAVSGANMGANAIFKNNEWTKGYSNIELNGGVVDVSVEILSVPQNIRKITSVANYNHHIKSVEVILAPSRFSKFAYYSVSEGNDIWWMEKDTVFGPFHTQDNLRCDNHPVFGVVGYRSTIKGKIIYKDYYDKYGRISPPANASKTEKNAYNSSITKDKPIFHGSFQEGVDEPLPTNGLQPLRDAAADNGFKIKLSTTTTTTQTWICKHNPPKSNHTSPSTCNNGQWKYTTTVTKDTVYLTFVRDSMKIKMGYNKSTTTYLSSAVAPNGVIYVEGMNIHMKGTVSGQYSVVGDDDIYIDDDIIYNKDPNQYPNSTDILGIIAKNNVYITDNSLTKNIKIQAAIYCESGGFGAENYDTRGNDGDIKLLGGITQNIRRAVGTYSGGIITHGYAKRYRYDPRLMTMYPPFYPFCGGFTIVSWKE